MAGTTFLRARSPVTPKITTAHGGAICGSRLSRLSRNGFCQVSAVVRVLAGLICAAPQHRSALHRRRRGSFGGRVELLLCLLEQLCPRLLELLHTFVFQNQ